MGTPCHKKRLEAKIKKEGLMKGKIRDAVECIPNKSSPRFLFVAEQPVVAEAAARDYWLKG